jgi:hypothetical protein
MTNFKIPMAEAAPDILLPSIENTVSPFGHLSLGFGFVVSSAERSFPAIIREHARE